MKKTPPAGKPFQSVRGLRWDDDHAWRSTNLGRLLLTAFSFWERAIVTKLHAAGFRDVRPAHLGVMRQLDIGGTRITDVAERAGVTKQAMGQMVAECEKLNLVTTVPDVTDGRAKVVLFTNRGRSLIMKARSIIERTEAEVEEMLGRARNIEFRAALATLAESETRSSASAERKARVSKRRASAATGQPDSPS
jgi:DNA-binding MarR family transcriptional regulator